MTLADAVPNSLPQPLFARFSRRLKAMFIDWIVVLALIFGAAFLSSLARDDGLSRALGFAVIAAVLLYEPVMVSRFGGSIGHIAMNRASWTTRMAAMSASSRPSRDSSSRA